MKEEGKSKRRNSESALRTLLTAVFDGIVGDNDEKSKNLKKKRKKVGIGARLDGEMKEFYSQPSLNQINLPFVDGRDTKQEFDLTDPKDGELWQ